MLLKIITFISYLQFSYILQFSGATSLRRDLLDLVYQQHHDSGASTSSGNGFYGPTAASTSSRNGFYGLSVASTSTGNGFYEPTGASTSSE